LHQLSATGAALLMSHHPRKSDGSEGTASRGSGALPGFVDTIVELRRYDPERDTDRRRVLRGYSRFSETPHETVLELRPGNVGYVTLGGKSDVRQADRLAVIVRILPGVAPGLTVEEVHAAWPDDAGIPRPSVRTLKGDLTACRQAIFTGTGVKGDPKRYYTPPPEFRQTPKTPHLAGMESEAAPDALTKDTIPFRQAQPPLEGTGMQESRKRSRTTAEEGDS